MRQIYLFTDFGFQGPYVGQMRARLSSLASDRFTVIDLMHDAPNQDPHTASYLLSALASDMPPDAICVAVVDPGVGTDRLPVVLLADDRVFIGPDNGLLSIVGRHASKADWRRIDWRPENLSKSFHGRDIFAPAAAGIAGDPDGWLAEWTSELNGGSSRPGCDWPEDLSDIIYVDGYGNAMTGLRASTLPEGVTVCVGNQPLPRAGTFGDVPPGTAFWYENSLGLIEIAVNQARADRVLGLTAGTPVSLQ